MSILVAMSLSIEKIAGVYYLHSVRETASGFKLNTDYTFQFFFAYGALDRYGSGKFTIQDDIIMLQSRTWVGKDFALIASDTSGKGVTVKITDANPIFQKNVFASLKNGEEGSWMLPDARGEIHFPDHEANIITLAFEFCRERLTFYPVENKEHNYFEFHLEPWIMEVFFDRFTLKAKKHVLIGRHPLLRGEEFIFEKG